MPICKPLPVIMKPQLELPRTIRLPEKSEIPMDSSILERLKSWESAPVVEGFKILTNGSDPEIEKLPFNFYAEININNSRLWKLIIELSNHLPDEISLIYNHSDCEPEYGENLNKKQTLDFLANYETELTSDTFIEIGMISQSDSELIELFLSEYKYIKFWGVDQESFNESMNRFDLKEIKDIQFIDEFPNIREPLRLYNESITESNDLIELLKQNF